MKKIVILGSAGMAGHMILNYLSSLEKYDLQGISRKEIDIEEDLGGLIELLNENKPDVVINCIGLLVKASQEEPDKAIYINGLFPHVLECRVPDSKIIHISTDCVFDGKRGNYDEADLPNEKKWYGKSKAIGEIINKKDLTIRTSIIGPEIKQNGTGLFKWFMDQKGEVSGYNNVLWNGITTLELSKQIDRILDTDLTGLYHLVTDASISKFELLLMMKEVFQRTDVEVKSIAAPEDRNKVLINNRKTEYDPNIPSYLDQLTDLKEIL